MAIYDCRTDTGKEFVSIKKMTMWRPPTSVDHNVKPFRDKSLIPASGETFIVKKVKPLANFTEVTSRDGRFLRLRPFLYLSSGEKLEFLPSVEKFETIYKLVSPPKANLQRVVVHPPYEVTELVEMSPHVFKVTFHERRSKREWKSARFLEKFHYRGKGLNRLVGRRTVLLAHCEGYGVIGYGVLSSTVGAAHPRFKLFNTNFTHQMRTKLINQIIRIPRIVIHPEFRGMGLGALMAKHLCNYARSYWDIGGYRPVMVEVIAAMTEYHKFFQSAGFLHLGYTNSNSNRRKDRIILRPMYGRGNWAQRDHRNYDFYESTQPKPYLIFPLQPYVQALVHKRFPTEPIKKKILKRVITLKKAIRFQNACVRYKASDGITERAYEIMESFGVDKAQMFSTVLRNFSLNIFPGDVVLITGASGSGKSTVIKLLTRELAGLRSSMQLEGVLSGHDIRRVAILTTKLNNRWPLIDQIGSDLREAIHFLNVVGLAEAHLYLKRPRQISEGQKYRFAVAKLCHTRKQIWIADEFASTLDPGMAAVLAKGLRKISWKYGATMVLAASHIDGFVPSLLPNVLVQLRWGGIAKIHRIKLIHRVKEETIHLWLRNQGATDLSSLELGGIDLTGKLILFSSYKELKAGGSTAPIVISSEALKNFTAIAVRSSIGVGDILYLT